MSTLLRQSSPNESHKLDQLTHERVDVEVYIMGPMVRNLKCYVLYVSLYGFGLGNFRNFPNVIKLFPHRFRVQVYLQYFFYLFHSYSKSYGS